MAKPWAILGAACVMLCASGGCALQSPSRQARELDGYVGGQISALVQEKGVPIDTYPMKDGKRVYFWRSSRLVYDWHGRQWLRFCETRVLTGHDGVVERWSWRGNECPPRGEGDVVPDL